MAASGYMGVCPRFDDLHMEERMEAIGEIIMESGYPTVLCFQVHCSHHTLPVLLHISALPQ